MRFTSDENVSFQGTGHDANVFRPSDTVARSDGRRVTPPEGERDGRAKVSIPVSGSQDIDAVLTVKTHKDGKKHFG